MQRLSETPPGRCITMCLYGGSATGKTWLTGTLGSRTLYCNVEKRLATLQSPAFQKKHPGFDPLIITVSEEPIPEEGAKATLELKKEINDAFLNHHEEFDHIVVDGASAVRRFNMNLGLEINLKSGKSRTIAPDNKVRMHTEGFRYADVSVNDYQTEMGMTEKFIITMKETCEEYSKNFIFTAHERIRFKKKASVGDEPVVDKIYPGFTGQTFPDNIPGLFDLVWHTKVMGGLYCVELEGNSSLVAKTCWSGKILDKDGKPAKLLTEYPKGEGEVNLLKVFEAIRSK